MVLKSSIPWVRLKLKSSIYGCCCRKRQAHPFSLVRHREAAGRGDPGAVDCRASLAMADVGGRVTARPQAVAVYLRRLLMKAMYARQQDSFDGIHIFVMARLLQLL
jgi:hypothetical protein